MKWIKLTRPDGKPRWINPSNAQDVTEDTTGTGATAIVLASGAAVHVKERPEDVVRSLEGAADAA